MNTEGDCCSSTWIESIENVPALIGHTIASVESINLGEPTNTAYTKYEALDDDEYPYKNNHDLLQDYGVKFTTDAGITTVVYRNGSNGYYGGSHEWTLFPVSRIETRQITDDV